MVVPHLIVEPTIQWTTYDGTVVATSTSGNSLSLNFNHIMNSDGNQYTCTASIDITDIALSVHNESTFEILLAGREREREREGGRAHSTFCCHYHTHSSIWFS